MKVHHSSKPAGNVLLVCLFTIIAVGLVLVTYLQTCSTHHQLTVRSQSWNWALPVAEAGLEEALTQANYTLGKNLTSNGWTKVSKLYVKTRYLDSNAYYTVSIDNTGSGKSLSFKSTGYVRPPLSTVFLSRTIEANASLTNQIFTKAMIAKKHIRAGKGTLIDSFDSSSSKYSTGGKYDPAKRRDTASVAATSDNKHAIKVDKTRIYGDAATSAKGGVEFKNTGTLGDKSWVDGGNIGGQPGKVSSAFNYDFPEVQPPWTSGGLPPVGGKYNAEDYQYILTSGNWEIGSSVNLTKPMIVTSNSQVVLYLKNDFKASQNIVIEKGASLKIYMEGKKFEITDRDIVLNTGDATQFQYFGLPTNKDIRMKKKGDVAFTGIVYAPSAKIKIEGGSDVIGSVVGKCVHLKHDGAFHFDEAIWGKGSAYDMFMLSSWEEQ
jgi:hypothetical protein